ncbi:MAG: DUF411 domain-containing protein [Alphaproteobacteria bacterium]
MNTTIDIRRRSFLGVVAAIALTPALPVRAAEGTLVKVYKSPTCGCCSMWVEHLLASGFEVEAEDVADLDAVKRMAGVPGHLLACHTAMVDGYVIEGHTPAAAIEKLLAERPAIRGLAVPGMPAGSPGMPSSEPERYDVIAFGGGEDHVFMSFVETDPV